MTLNEANLEKRFNSVSTSQGSIQSLSFFCLHYKNYHKKIAHIWLRCLQKAEVPHRLTLIYLANDIVQNAKRKNVLSFIEDFKNILKDTIPYLRDERIKKSVERVFSIWQDRGVFDSKFTNKLKATLNSDGRGGSNKASDPGTELNSDTPVKSFHKPSGSRQTVSDLMECLNKLDDIKKNIEVLRSSEDNIVDRIAQGTFSSDEDNSEETLSDLKNYITFLKNEVDERNRLSKLLEDSMNDHKKILKDSEDQLSAYKLRLEQITKLHSESGIAH